MKLTKLCWYYDKNKVQISGGIDRATSDDERKVFEGFGWEVLEISGSSEEEIGRALEHFDSQARAI